MQILIFVIPSVYLFFKKRIIIGPYSIIIIFFLVVGGAIYFQFPRLIHLVNVDLYLHYINEKSFIYTSRHVIYLESIKEVGIEFAEVNHKSFKSCLERIPRLYWNKVINVLYFIRKQEPKIIMKSILTTLLRYHYDRIAHKRTSLVTIFKSLF